MKQGTAFADGHFYSPVVDREDIIKRQETIWKNNPELQGINFDPDQHEIILSQWFPRHLDAYDYPEQLEETPDLNRFFTQNSQFSWLDSRTLFVLLNEWKPKRMIEIGSGFSSLLTADVNTRYLDKSIDFTCIEPYPREFLKKSVLGITSVITERVEKIPLDIFNGLEAGDILFIDSSHVAKTGSDVNYLVFEVLPSLKPGVRIHIHDIFLPREYPKEWVIKENRSWNEQYVIRALLMYSTAFRVLFSCSYAFHHYPELITLALKLKNGRSYGGSSLWLERL